MAEGTLPTHLEPSQLGTKEYWDSLYTTEITNHAHDPSDTGTVWFSDSDAEEKILTHLDSLTEDPSSTPHLSYDSTSFLDLGCGNGSLLLALRAEGWKGQCLGVDYSPQSIALAKQIVSAQEADDSDDSEQPIDFQEWDVINGPYDPVLAPTADAQGWDVVLDKGTFDAISLSDEKDARGRRLCEGYRDRVLPLVKKGTGLFVLTSCNWTEEEMKGWFVGANGAEDGFEVASRVEYRSFSFGGMKGQTISTLCFRRKG